MTDATAPDVDDLSQRIAARGRVALVERLRTAYRDAASAHADIVSLEEDRLEALVQNAADHADGLQWRRALAGLVAEELGVSVAEALSHPAVVRAQSIVGAPSYEQSLAELITRPIPPPLPARRHDQRETDTPLGPIEGQLRLEDEHGVEGEPEDVLSVSEELETAIADDTFVELLPEPDPSLEVPTELYEIPVDDEADTEAQPEATDPPNTEAQPEATDPPDTEAQPEATDAPDTEAQPEATDARDTEAQPEPEPVQPEPEPGHEPNPDTDPIGPIETVDSTVVAELRVPAIHLGGVANLPTGSDGLDLRLSQQGLDIMRGNDTIIGRLPWQEIEALEVPAQRRRRRGATDAARLVVRTHQGDASFEIPGFTSEELRNRVELRMDRYRDAQSGR